jgi:hypothetical protein
MLKSYNIHVSLYNEDEMMIEGDDFSQDFLESIPYFTGRLNANFQDSLLPSPHINELDLSMYKEINTDAVVAYFIYKNEQRHKRLDNYLAAIINMKKDGSIIGILQLAEFFSDFSIIQAMIDNRMKISEAEFLAGCSEDILTKIVRDYLEKVFSVKLPFNERIHKFVVQNDGIARIIWHNHEYKMTLLKDYFKITDRPQLNKYINAQFQHLIQLSNKKTKHKKILGSRRHITIKDLWDQDYDWLDTPLPFFR